MFEMRVHGLGGQGAVTLVTWVAQAAYGTGKHVQAFPFFSAERRGAPVKAYLRVDDNPIDLRSQIVRPDLLVTMSAELTGLAIAEGIAEDGELLINAGPELAERLSKRFSREIYHIDATGIALEHGLEIEGMPMVNVPLLGAIVRRGKLAPFEAVADIVANVARSGMLEPYEDAVRRGFEEVTRIAAGEPVDEQAPERARD
jgi:2-oxoacid:acceptor oxidoreductase gamma subunit (pyruvate/2-ketoisovalerate family)